MTAPTLPQRADHQPAADIAPDWTRNLNGEHGSVVDVVGRHVRVLIVTAIEVSIPLTDVHPPEAS